MNGSDTGELVVSRNMGAKEYILAASSCAHTRSKAVVGAVIGIARVIYGEYGRASEEGSSQKSESELDHDRGYRKDWGYKGEIDVSKLRNFLYLAEKDGDGSKGDCCLGS
jgi:hypothetical protein